jgi:signal transduction histidine kinase
VGSVPRSRITALLIATALPVGVLALRIVGRPVLGDDSPFLYFFSALALAAWYGGFLPGALATALGTIMIAAFSLPPMGPKGKVDVAHVLHFIVFIATGLLISALMERLHNARTHSAKAEKEMEGRVKERTAELDRANRELTAERNRLVRILDQMPEAVYIVNPQFGIEYVNPAMEREFGHVDGQKCYQYTRGPGAGICSWCRNEQVFEGKSFTSRVNSERNQKIYDCFEAPILMQNGILCKLKILHDITGIQSTQEELLSKHREIQRLSSELLTAQETERLRISRELHDDLGQSLTLIKLKVGLIDMNLNEGQQPLKMYCNDASAHVDQAVENMRRISRDLSPVAIETMGLTIALRRLAEDFNSIGGIRIRTEIEDINHLLPLQSGILLYRILQEGLNNIVKHSGASDVSISIGKKADGIHFELDDDGEGLDSPKANPAKKAESAGFGLTIMKERVRTLGGSLEIQSRKAEGTRLRFTIPFQSEVAQ